MEILSPNSDDIGLKTFHDDSSDFQPDSSPDFEQQISKPPKSPYSAADKREGIDGDRELSTKREKERGDKAVSQTMHTYSHLYMHKGKQ